MPGMSDEFQKRGEQWQRLAKWQEEQRLVDLTAYVDTVIGGSGETANGATAAKAQTNDAGRLLMICVLCVAIGALVAVVVMRAIYG